MSDTEWNYVKCWQPTSSALISDAIDDPSVSYSAAVVEAEDSGSEQVPVESSDLVGQQHVALVTQEDGTQQQVGGRENMSWKLCISCSHRLPE